MKKSHVKKAKMQATPEASQSPRCEHEWVVFSTALAEVCLMLQCVRAGRWAQWMIRRRKSGAKGIMPRVGPIAGIMQRG